MATDKPGNVIGELAGLLNRGLDLLEPLKKEPTAAPNVIDTTAEDARLAELRSGLSELANQVESGRLGPEATAKRLRELWTLTFQEPWASNSR